MPSSPLRLVAGRLVFFFKVFSGNLLLQSRKEPVRSQLSSMSSETLLLDSVFFRTEKTESKNKNFATRSSTLYTCPRAKKIGILALYRLNFSVGGLAYFFFVTLCFLKHFSVHLLIYRVCFLAALSSSRGVNVGPLVHPLVRWSVGHL